jgi:hypothetical protein
VHVAWCILVPLAIGSVMYGLLEAWSRVRRGARPEADEPQIDYTI